MLDSCYLKKQFRPSSGIYRIKCLVNDKVYIGESTNVRSRIRQHLYNLRRGTHDNISLQNDWNLYGEDSFYIYCLEYCEDEELWEREEFYISLYKATNTAHGYNIMSASNAKKNNIYANSKLYVNPFSKENAPKTARDIDIQELINRVDNM